MRTKIEHDALTGETVERPYTDEENAQADQDELNAVSPLPHLELEPLPPVEEPVTEETPALEEEAGEA
jgi:hypothetical protein